jgi:Zn-finger nucleic acid-binding protein
VDATPRAAVDAPVRRCGSCGAVVATGSRICDYCSSEIVRDPGDLSLLCPECFARNAERSRFCTACGVAFRPETPGATAIEVPCPDCGGLMPARTVGGVGVNECPACHGLWVPGERFDLLVSRAIEAQRAARSGHGPPPAPRVRGGNPVTVEVRYRKCPVCDAFMLRRNYRRTSGVVVDRCRDHGTWLDADELEQIAGFILSGGLERAERARESTMRPERHRPGTPGRSRASADFARILMERDVHHGQRRLLGNFVEFLNDLLS